VAHDPNQVTYDDNVSRTPSRICDHLPTSDHQPCYLKSSWTVTETLYEPPASYIDPEAGTDLIRMPEDIRATILQAFLASLGDDTVVLEHDLVVPDPGLPPDTRDK
jgi:hypothetical protein